MKSLLINGTRLIFFLAAASYSIATMSLTRIIVTNQCDNFPTSCTNQIPQVNLNASALTAGYMVSNFPLAKGGRYDGETYISKALFVLTAYSLPNCQVSASRVDPIDRVGCRNPFSDTVSVLLQNTGTGSCRFIGQNGTMCSTASISY